ncbi:small, acid-soluble spore protein Tlp [Paenibacillus cisolokensis]|uniref:Small, acid-soluble spore protein Tlp n=1 Tax=Paenibacillus cisolokensis TaxID=1658519 RepID=A0ABQ4N4X1_9BACL|nr:small acid-soluble spore protein Tlp [Paenibacillus cisolokensis]GIQ63215.1 small, acid-soluble spore protein Tlp [Paenibacillus cisolokensis]
MTPKPDNREDNVERLQQAVQNTEENLHEAEDYLNEFADEISSGERDAIQAKNERRKNSMQSMKNEIRDEAND